jgi:hypothetical protein
VSVVAMGSQALLDRVGGAADDSIRPGSPTVRTAHCLAMWRLRQIVHLRRPVMQDPPTAL